MAVAKVIEITASSPKSFTDALQEGVQRAHKTLKNMRRAWIKDQQVVIGKGKITTCCVTMNVSFVLKD